MRSKIFIEFIALIIRSSFYSAINNHILTTGRGSNYLNVVSVLSKLEKIELIRIGDGVYHLDHAVTARQKDILSVFVLSADDIKAKCRVLSQALAVIDGTCAKTDNGPDPDVRDDSTMETKGVQDDRTKEKRDSREQDSRP